MIVNQQTNSYLFDRSKLSLSYDASRLQQEVLEVIRKFPPYIHYSVIPLTVAEKSDTNVTDYSDPNWACWTTTSLLLKCPYIMELLDSLQCRKTNVRLLRLEPGGELKEHTDPQLNLQFRNQVRLHVPIFTNKSLQFILNGSPVPLCPGELWYLRLSDPHSVRNHGQSERIQLSIDVVVNQWIENMITEGAIPAI